MISEQNISHFSDVVELVKNGAGALPCLSSGCYNGALNSDKPDYRFLLLFF
jgi:hypothetical protein